MSAQIKTLVTCVCAALLVVASTPSRAFAQNPYTIDGVVPANGTVSGPDEDGDPSGSNKELGPVNSNATKVGVIHAATPPMLDFTNPNGQVDLRRIWTQTTKAANNDIWFYFAWERDANTGSGFIAYEFQQSALSPSCAYTAAEIDMILPQSGAETSLINSCNPWQNRQAGDFLIMWDQTGSGLTMTKRVFTMSGGALVLGPNQPLGSAVAAISADGFRGEAAVNLTTDVFPQDGSCISFANFIPGTVTGNSDTADYKDTVLALFEPISNCGIVTVTKHIDPSDATGSFPYTLARADGSPVRFDGTAQISNTLTFHGDNSGSPIASLIAGDNYTLVEAPQSSPWALVSIVCTTGSQPPVDLTSGGTFTVDPTAQTDCVITNKRLRGSVQVIKQVVNNNGGTALPGAFTIALGDAANTTFAGSDGVGSVFTFDHGYAFNVSEIAGPAGYALVSMSGACSGAIVAGTTQTCTLINDDQPGQLTVIKHVVNDNGGTAVAGQWTMNVSAVNPSQASFAGSEGGVTVTVDAGAFSVTESGGPAGYVQTGAVGCSGSIGIGESRTCVITNDDQAAQLTVIKVVVNDNGGTAVPGDWTMNVSAANPSQASFAGAAAPGVTITLDAGAFAVTESGGPGGYSQTGADGCSGTVAVGESRTCVITNDDEKANPAGVTVQRAILHDALTITGIRTGSPGDAATVTFRLYADAACSALVGAEGPVGVSLNGSTGTATTVNGILVTQSATTVYYWTAEYTGDQFNTAFTTACGTEKTTLVFEQ